MKTREREVSQDSEKLEGRYANYFKIGYNAFEFVIDFCQCYEEDKEEQFHTRIITNPSYAKNLLSTLQKSIEEYEKTFGTIKQG
jgi:hypothetical protein